MFNLEFAGGSSVKPDPNTMNTPDNYTGTHSLPAGHEKPSMNLGHTSPEIQTTGFPYSGKFFVQKLEGATNDEKRQYAIDNYIVTCVTKGEYKQLYLACIDSETGEDIRVPFATFFGVQQTGRKLTDLEKEILQFCKSGRPRNELVLMMEGKMFHTVEGDYHGSGSTRGYRIHATTEVEE